jgi:hypothetical protein
VVHTVTATDNTGIRAASVSVNGTPGCAVPGVTCTTQNSGTQFSWFFDLASDGIYRLQVTAGNGNQQTASFMNEVKVDLHDPVATAQVSPSTPSAAGWYRSPVTITLTGADGPGGSGVDNMEYQLDTGSLLLVAPGDQVPISADGIHTLTSQAVDVAGRRSQSQSLIVQIDQTPPTVTCSQAPPPQISGWSNTEVTVSFTAADSLSGIATVSAPVLVNTEGADQPITGTASDKAGNSASATCRVSLDKTPPAITVSASPATLWPPNGKMVPVTISGTITDQTSGVSTATYAVKDEYGSVQPSGSVTLVNSSYSFNIQLQASRNGNDKDGRQYTITVSARDNAGNQRSVSTGVTVPHDQGQ